MPTCQVYTGATHERQVGEKHLAAEDADDARSA
jgi:hypothetical protein